MTELSVVLITRNQAWSVSRLVESVLQATLPVSSKEIILVDSASTDATVELACRYPITIFRLQPGQRLSPAIGRYIGFNQTHGEYILFLDGDTRLFPSWLEHALPVMRQPQIAAVTGRVIHLPTSAVAGELPLPLQKTRLAPPREVSYGSGAATMYRRSVLENVGTFNPYLESDEEPELGLRIRHAGYRILELDHPVVCHYSDAPVAVCTVLSRRKRNFLVGIGQAARYHLRSGLLRHWLKERWWGPASLIWLATGLVMTLGSLIAHDFRWLASWTVGLCLLIAYLSFRKRSLIGALVAAFNWVLLAEGVLRGFLMKSLPPERFQANVEMIQDPRCAEPLNGALKRKKPEPESPSHRDGESDSAKMQLSIPVSVAHTSKP